MVRARYLVTADGGHTVHCSNLLTSGLLNLNFKLTYMLRVQCLVSLRLPQPFLHKLKVPR